MLLIRNTYWRKFGVSLMLLASFMLVMTAFHGCSNQDDSPTASTGSEEVVIQDDDQIEISDAELAAFTVQAKLYQKLIDEMDPYVTENKDGTYSFDSVGFQAVSQNFNDDDKVVINDLKKGIPIVNGMILKNSASKTLGSACWWYWWGQRCCYWGSTAHYYVMVLAMGGPIPVFGWGYAVFAAWAGYFTNVYGGFCFNRTWAGGVWLTTP